MAFTVTARISACLCEIAVDDDSDLTLDEVRESAVAAARLLYRDAIDAAMAVPESVDDELAAMVPDGD
jgi:hypothetical protein